jgi:hypothetical protein
LRLLRGLALVGSGRVVLSGSLWLTPWQLLVAWYMMQWKFGYVFH